MESVISEPRAMKAAVFGTLFAEPIGERGFIPAGSYDRNKRMYIGAGTGLPALIRSQAGSCTSVGSCQATSTGSGQDSDSTSDAHSDTD